MPGDPPACAGHAPIDFVAEPLDEPDDELPDEELPDEPDDDVPLDPESDDAAVEVPDDELSVAVAAVVPDPVEPDSGFDDEYRSLYQPPPFSWNAVREMIRSSASAPHASQTVLSGSAIRC